MKKKLFLMMSTMLACACVLTGCGKAEGSENVSTEADVVIETGENNMVGNENEATGFTVKEQNISNGYIYIHDIAFELPLTYEALEAKGIYAVMGEGKSGANIINMQVEVLEEYGYMYSADSGFPQPANFCYITEEAGEKKIVLIEDVYATVYCNNEDAGFEPTKTDWSIASVQNSEELVNYIGINAASGELTLNEMNAVLGEPVVNQKDALFVYPQADYLIVAYCSTALYEEVTADTPIDLVSVYGMVLKSSRRHMEHLNYREWN